MTQQLSEGQRLPFRSVSVKLLDEARNVAAKILDRLRALQERFPSAPVSELLEESDGDHEEPEPERRRSWRMRETGAPASVAKPQNLAEWRGATLLNRSPRGVALLLNRPAQVGSTLLVWFGVLSGLGWVPFEVRHCRQRGQQWVVGGEFVGESPPR